MRVLQSVRAVGLLRSVIGIGLGLAMMSAASAESAHPAHRASRRDNVPAIYVGERKIRVPAVIDRGRVLVPVRGVFEAIGAAVSYSAPHFVVVRKDGAVIAALILGRTHAIVNYRAVDLDAPPVRRDGSIFVPLRIVAEAAGATVAFKSRPPVIHIEPRRQTVAVSAAKSEAPATAGASDVAEAATASWRIGVAIVTGLCVLGCVVLTARRLGPAIFAAPPVPKRALGPAADGDEAPRIPPADLVALTSVEASGEARVHKNLVRETRTIEVPVTREELVIEYAGEGGKIFIEGRVLESGETVRIPLWEERVHVDVTKHVILNEDIVIGKRRISANGTPTEPMPSARAEQPFSAAGLEPDTPRAFEAPLDSDVAEGSPS